MKYCGMCGRRLADHDRFCSGCGYQLNPAPTQGAGVSEAMHSGIKDPNSFCAEPPENVRQTQKFAPNYAAQGNIEPQKINSLVQTLSQRLLINGIIWIVVGALQILGGIFLSWLTVIVGVLNIISAVHDITYSKQLLNGPQVVVSKFEPVAGAVITMVYNVIFGGVIGIAGSIYYFAAIRDLVMKNKDAFLQYEGSGNTMR